MYYIFIFNCGYKYYKCNLIENNKNKRKKFCMVI